MAKIELNENLPTETFISAGDIVKKISNNKIAIVCNDMSYLIPPQFKVTTLRNGRYVQWLKKDVILYDGSITLSNG